MKTTVVHCKKAPYDVFIGRPSKWGNPFKIGRDGNREEVVKKFATYFYASQKMQDDAVRELSGKNLGCFCKPNNCHGDVIAEYVNNYGG